MTLTSVSMTLPVGTLTVSWLATQFGSAAAMAGVTKSLPKTVMG
jgi:hypothetical protein